MKPKSATFYNMAMSGQKPDVLRNQWFAMALVSSTIFWLLAWYGDTAQSMVAIWQSNNTYTQCFLIAPISAWMIWQKRHAIAALDLRPDLRVLPMLALVGFGWLLGEIAGVGIFQPFGMVLMIPLLVWAYPRAANRLVRKTVENYSMPTSAAETIASMSEEEVARCFE